MSKNSKMNWNELKIENMEDIYKLLNELYQSNKNYLYRGQSNHGEKEWELCSSLYRELDSLGIASFLSFVVEKLKFIENKKGLKNDPNNYLSILSEMQHYGNPTALIDFTSNILHALWFACSEDEKEEEIKEKERYFQLFLLPQKNNKYTMENMESTDIYSCPKNITRGLSQKSFFILHNKEDMIQEYKIEKIKINKKLKDKILIFLESQNINAESIFPDLKGMYQSFFKYSSNSLFFQGLHFNKKGNYDEAIKKYEKAIEINPKFEVAYYNLGNIFFKQGNYEEAIEKYKKAIEINPNYPQSYNNWGAVLEKKGKYAEAIEKYEKAIEINPNHAYAYNNWGNILNKQGNYEEAIEKYKKAIEIYSNFGDAYFNWAVVLKNQGNYDEAIKKVKKAIEINPDFKKAHELLEKVKNRLKDLEK